MPPAGPAPPTSPGPTAVLALTVDSLGSEEAVTGASDVIVDGSQSTGNQLRHSIDFGDGRTAADSVVRHIYQVAGTYDVTLTVVDGSGRSASATKKLVVASPLGTWLFRGVLQRSGIVDVRTLTLTEQQGLGLRGTMTRAGRSGSQIEGTLTSDRRMRVSVQGDSEVLEGVIPSVLSGERGSLALTARGGSADGQTLTFTRRIGEPSGPPPDAVLRMRFYAFSAPYAVKQISPIEFDASPSRGDDLTYFIEFGDGQVATELKSVHPIEQTGNYTAQLTVVDRFGRSDVERMPFEVRTLAYRIKYYWWEASVPPSGNNITLQITSQEGTAVAGWIYQYPGPDQLFDGTVAADGNVRLRLTDSDVTLVGSLVLGPTYDSTRLDLTYLGGPHNGRSLAMRFRGGY